MKKILTTLPVIVSTLAFVSAQTAPGQNLSNLIAAAQRIVNQLVPLAIGLVIAALFYGIVMFVWKGRTDPKIHDDMLKWIGYSILGIFVMVSLWGIIYFMANIIGVGPGQTAPVIIFPSGPTN